MLYQTGLLFLVTGVVLGCYVVNLIGAINSINNVRLLEFKDVETTEFKKQSKTFKVKNFSFLACGKLDISFRGDELLHIDLIKGKTVNDIASEIILKKRGIYQVTYLQYFSNYPFGLINVRKKVKTSGSIKVFPMVYPCEPPPAGGFEPMIGGEFKGDNKAYFGIDFAGVRPYKDGDPVKLIHWKSSSKGLGIMVKEFNEERAGRITLILDTYCDKKEENLDKAVRAAASLIFEALAEGHHLKLLELTKFETMSISPFTDLSNLLTYLAGVAKRRKDISLENLEEKIGSFPSKTSYSFVLPYYAPNVVEMISKLADKGKFVSLYLPDEFFAKKKKDSDFPQYFNKLIKPNIRFYKYKSNEIIKHEPDIV